MRESQLGFQYSWADLQPVRALAITVLVAQLAGALLGFFFAAQSSWFMRLWLGGALATFPAFLVGLAIQSRIRPGSIGENRVLVRRLGLIAFLLSVVAAFMPMLELGA
jgi:hypothetical protein